MTLLSLAVFLNYVDRGNLATASPLLSQELQLSNVQLGILFSAFFWSYAPLQPLAGWIAQRFDVRYVLAGGLAIWSLATALTGLATSFAMVLALRVLLGIGESVTYPCNAKLLAQRAAAHQRGRANGFIAVGQSLGPTIGTLIGGYLLAQYGWRVTFLFFGIASLVWLLPWMLATRGGVVASSVDDADSVPYRHLLRERALWGTAILHFCGNYAYYFTLTWLPLLLVKTYGFSLKQMAVIGGGVYAMQALAAALGGWWGDRRISQGTDPNDVWKPMIITGMVGVAVAMALCVNAGATVCVVLLLVAGVFFGLQSPALGSITQTLAGPRVAGRWMGVQNFIANMAGVTAPLITGFVVDATNEFYWAFAIAAVVTLAGALAVVWLIRRVTPVLWPAN